jgi:hypothetical protein
MQPRTAYIVLIVAIIAVGVLLFGSSLYSRPAPEPVKSNMVLLGEVTTVVDNDDPLVKELRDDDVKNGRK